MANYDYMLVCPSCGLRVLNLLNYGSLMVLRRDLGLFTIECPNCSERVSSIQSIPDELKCEIEAAAVEIGAGMGRANHAE